MADNVPINPGIGGAVIATDDIAGVQYQRIKLVLGDNGINAGDVSSTNPIPVSGPVTNTELRASSVVTITHEHNKTHEGSFFSGGYYSASLANNATLDILIDLDTSSFHVQASTTAGGDCTIQLYEDTIYTGGTPINVTNHNRISSNTFIGSILHTPSISNLGNQLNGTGLLMGGSQGKTYGGSFGFANEMILAPTKNYLYRITNISGGSIKAYIHIEGYQNIP
jgi:hypothetical protein